ncbi:MAG: hypothetical protein JSS83_28315 [Cyanobacteria bacterium SZAS LIN-3]|nr:hypothetical protein [Cyanobacteria bacterium SZAS LIN-3]MBS2008326.1 hypothetical protein [Cyanobacteria bacterium SZAS TMP-1]
MAHDTPPPKPEAHTTTDAAQPLFSARALAELDMKSNPAFMSKAALPLEFTPNKKDLEIVDQQIAAAMKFAESRMTKEQIARVNVEANIPHKYIQQAADHMKAPNQVTAKPGDSYWSVAHDVVAQRKGVQPSNPEVHTMVKTMAAHNGKTMEEANHLKVGETIKIPPAFDKKSR